jgi:hypothetical protein
MQAPCKDCQERHRLCHSHCDKYQAYRQALDEWNKLTQDEKRKYGSLNEYEAQRNIKIHKLRGGK